MWNKAVNIAGWIIGVTCLFVLLGAAHTSSSDTVLHQVKVDIDFGDENYFINAAQVEEIVGDLGYETDSTRMDDIDPGRIEHLLENNAYIRDAEVYKELNGRLDVDVKVRQPIMRVYNLSGQSMYVDDQGVFMPLSNRYAARAPVVNGLLTIDLNPLIGTDILQLPEVSKHKDAELLAQVFEIVNTCRKDAFWKAQFNQVYVNQDRELELIPRVGDHRILVGNAQNIDKKLNKLRIFYEKGLNKTGWNEYKTINLKYANQVVCTKS